MKRIILASSLFLLLATIGLIAKPLVFAAKDFSTEACKQALHNIDASAPVPEGCKQYNEQCIQALRAVKLDEDDHEEIAACKEAGATDPLSGADGEGILIKAARLVALLTGIVSVIVIIIGGIQYALSTGDSAKINSAKNTILFAVIGLIIAMSAQFIITFVLKKL